jgi:hypothetical protein
VTLGGNACHSRAATQPAGCQTSCLHRTPPAIHAPQPRVAAVARRRRQMRATTFSQSADTASATRSSPVWYGGQKLVAWCSLWRRQAGSPEEPALLSRCLMPCPSSWVEGVNGPQTEGELSALRCTSDPFLVEAESEVSCVASPPDSSPPTRATQCVGPRAPSSSPTSRFPRFPVTANRTMF